MLLISNHVSTCNVPIPPDAVIRINVAWIETVKELNTLLEKSNNSIFLDYPVGRFKPPIPTIKLDEAVAVANSNNVVKYFAVSNAEDPIVVGKIKAALDTGIIMVPKIETAKGVRNLEKIVLAADTNIIMVDKDDLYLDTKRDNDLFHILIRAISEKCKKNNIEMLTLRGVVFSNE